MGGGMVANVVDIDARTSIESRARKWLVRMDGDAPLTEVERQALREWLSRSALHREVLTRLARFWIEANRLTDLVAGLEAARREERARRRGASWIRTMVMTGAVLASVIVVYCGLHQLNG